jgi:hypothetical protein
VKKALTGGGPRKARRTGENANEYENDGWETSAGRAPCAAPDGCDQTGSWETEGVNDNVRPCERKPIGQIRRQPEAREPLQVREPLREGAFVKRSPDLWKSIPAVGNAPVRKPSPHTSPARRGNAPLERAEKQSALTGQRRTNSERATAREAPRTARTAHAPSSLLPEETRMPPEIERKRATRSMTPGVAQPQDDFLASLLLSLQRDLPPRVSGCTRCLPLSSFFRTTVTVWLVVRFRLPSSRAGRGAAGGRRRFFSEGSRRDVNSGGLSLCATRSERARFRFLHPHERAP